MISRLAVSTTRPTLVGCARAPVVVDGGGHEQRRDGGELCGRVAVRQDDDVGPTGDRSLTRCAPFRARRQSPPPSGVARRPCLPSPPGTGSRWRIRRTRRLAVLVHVEQLGQVVAVDDRWGRRIWRHDEGVASKRLPSGRRGTSDVTSSSRMASSGGLVTWAKSWVSSRRRAASGPRAPRWRCPSHRADRLGAGSGHGGQDDPQFLLGVAEEPLMGDHACVLGVSMARIGSCSSLICWRVSHCPYGCSEARPDLISSSSTILPWPCHQEHPPRLEAALAHDGRRLEIEHADLARQHHQPGAGHPVAGGRRPLRSRTAPMRSIGERHCGGPSRAP